VKKTLSLSQGANSAMPGTRPDKRPGTTLCAGVWIHDGDGGQPRDYAFRCECTFFGTATTGINGVTIKGAGVGIVHCRIARDRNGAYWVTNEFGKGTYVNDTQVTRAVLQDGDIITIGEIRMQFTHDAGRTVPLDTRSGTAEAEHEGEGGEALLRIRKDKV